MDEYGPLMDDKHDDLPTKNADLPIYYNVLMQSISKESTEPELPFSRSSCKSHGTKC
jgi:hypothetical protein